MTCILYKPCMHSNQHSAFFSHLKGTVHYFYKHFNNTVTEKKIWLIKCVKYILMIIHINSKTSPFNGLQNIQQGWRFGGGKSRKEFCQ